MLFIPFVLIILTAVILGKANALNSKTNIEFYTPIYRPEKYPYTNSRQDIWDHEWLGPVSDDCYKLNKKDCLNNSNCGLCIKDKNATCVPGDIHGPLFKETCQGWAHTDYYDRHIFGEKVTRITPSWSAFYSDYEARYPSPQSRSTLIY